MRGTKFLTTVVAAMLLAGGVAHAQGSLKIAVVNLPQLVSQSPQAQRARAEMEEEFTSRRDDLQSRQEKLREDVQRLQRDGSVMSAEARDQLEQSIRDQQRRLQLAQSEFNEDVQRAEQKALEGLRNDVREVIQEFAESGDYDLILGDGVLFATDQVDITGQVLERLKSR
ncbi:OmpH family outer membrane protein [Spectribacter hydrogenoxidans]|uniref:OmpH family outer membrane protein n=1 Tax=Spectribacter hydrogenoxidans TaxID=3075608 RepID=A0ABU3C1E6_9GAMM|nr:OmpH family outer membrane protein [Salinisphaera sp. W335]MDT0635383.1 OmpH family outer membrane protein [Salinisphaera sp. W335]